MNSPQKMKLLDGNELSLQFEKSSFISTHNQYHILPMQHLYFNFTTSFSQHPLTLGLPVPICFLKLYIFGSQTGLAVSPTPATI